jgi:hypothetical protein
MRGLQKIAALWVGLSLLIILMADTTQSPAAEETEVHLQWAFGALTGPEDDPQLISVEKRSVLHSGDRMKIFLQPLTDCHLYLFYRSSQGEMTILLPTEGSGSRAAAGERITVPGGSQWFRLDEVIGLETFYLLASVRPLENLDTLCSRLFSAGSHSDRVVIGRQILSEITHLQKSRRSLTAAAERPIRIGGNLRGLAEDSKPGLPDISRIALEISASDFYSRTFTIDHR